MSMICILIPANNEEGYIGPCLEGLLAQVTTYNAEVIVSANACTDATVDIAHSYKDRFSEKGWRLEVIDSQVGGKPGALNRADAAATGKMRVYLDADVIMSPMLLDGLVQVLDTSEPVYASGRLFVSPAKSWITRAYGRIWGRLPFMTDGVPGAGLFAVNAQGRARWAEFPEIISDDTFVRLQFDPDERVLVPISYSWPLVEGFSALVRVRRRQNAGVDELEQLYPGILKREGKAALTPGYLAKLTLSDPVGMAIYLTVSLVVRAKRGTGWSRGR